MVSGQLKVALDELRQVLDPGSALSTAELAVRHQALLVEMIRAQAACHVADRLAYAADAIGSSIMAASP